uniref:Ankyrin repeat domain 45 n=1 Tax=Mus musculus TaxID=10090 RepID=A0A0A6YVY8_MOUSE
MGQNRPASSLRDPGVRGCRGGRHPRCKADSEKNYYKVLPHHY